MFRMFQFAAMSMLAAVAFPVRGMAQEVKVDAHAGANLSGFVSGKEHVVQDKKNTVGSNVGVGVSYELKNHLALSTGLDFLMTTGKYSVMSDYLTDGKLAYVYPQVKSKEVAVQIPVKIGYDFSLGKKCSLIPSVGAYARYSIASIKQDITENFVGDKPDTFKWDCFEQHTNGNNQLDAYKRWDVGMLAEVKFLYDKHYALALGYSRGFLNKSSQFNVKNQSFTFTLGYAF